MEESLMDLDLKIKDMQSLKSSLKREIDQNQLEALNLREELKALQNKIVTVSNEVKVSESTLIKRREEISTIDSLLDKERKLLEAEKRDIISMREGVSGENAVFQQEKKGAMEAIEENRRRLNRLEVSIMNQKADLENAEKQLNGQIQEISSRRIAVQELEIKAQAKMTEAEQARVEANKLKHESEKFMNDAKAELVAYQDRLKQVVEREKYFAEKDSHIKTCYNDIDVKKKEQKETENDLIIEQSKVRDVRNRLYKEIEVAKIEERKKAELKKEIA